MVDGKLLVALAGAALVALALCNTSSAQPPVVENWWGGTQFTTRAMPGAMVNGKEVAISGNYLNPQAMGSTSFVQVPSFQGVLSPRFSNVQYGANIRYNMPDRANMGVPCDPLTFGSMAKENYDEAGRAMTPASTAGPNAASRMMGVKAPPRAPGMENYAKPPSFGPSEGYCANCGTGQCGGGCPASCGKGGYGMGHNVAGGYELPSGYANGNYWDTYNSIPSQGVSVGSDLPVATMSTMDGGGGVDQFIAFNRIMPANTKSSSRLYAQGDFIRGDLPIVPCQSGWFSVYPDIARDVNSGALNVLTGAGGGGEAYNQMLNMVVAASGGSQTTLGGVNLADSLPQYNANMATSMSTDLKAAMGDIQVTAFP